MFVHAAPGDGDGSTGQRGPDTDGCVRIGICRNQREPCACHDAAGPERVDWRAWGWHFL